jgi:flagellin
MGRIDTNVAALQAQVGLDNSQSQLNTALQRLSTGLRINSGADDPAGLIASNSLESEIAGLNQAVSNSQTATNVISTADGALNEISSLLLNVKSLVVESANSGALSTTELQANQLQVDSAIQSITRIANTTSFAGLNLLNGSLAYVTSGVASSAISNADISQAQFGSATTIPVQVDVLTSARTADLDFKASSVANSVTLNVTGNAGTQTLTFTSGTHASAIAYAVNTISDSTGVKAVPVLGGTYASGITFQSTGWGSAQYVSVTAQTGTFNTYDTSGNAKSRTIGRDAVATVNGSLTVGTGLDLQVNTNSLDADFTLNSKFGAGKTSFAITGGGALFQLGSTVNSNEQISLGIPSVTAANLGNATTGFLNQIETGGSASLVGGQAETAGQIVDDAISQVSVLQGKLGAFQTNTLATNVDSLQVAIENVTASDSSIRDADFAQETSNLTRAQILVQAGTSVLATANSTPQDVLTLLQGH